MMTVPSQVFNAENTGLCWKHITSRMYFSMKKKSAAGFKVAKNWSILFLCINATGDLSSNLLIYCTENHCAIKGQNLLSVI